MSYTRRFVDGYVANIKYWHGLVYNEINSGNILSEGSRKSKKRGGFLRM